ncbi:MAG: ABC transporter permease [Chitinophagales bacterium]|nr:ABC transporter permease [Chitinophagales bacterium]
MSGLRYLLQKEFRQIFRNPTILRMILMVPTIQLLIMPLAADYEIKNINIAVVDHDHSTYSSKLVNTITASGYFRLISYGESYNAAFELLEGDKTDLILEIPQHFERNLVTENQQKLFIGINAINGVKAGVGSGYLSRIINNYNADIRAEWITPSKFNPIPVIEVANINWFNLHLNYQRYMVPGILVVLVTMVGSYLCALNIVKEKEIGTIEQINVTPIKKYHFILGKLIPFWVLGMFVFSLGLLVIARLVYGIVPLGSFALIYGFLALYLVAVLGIGLLMSTYAQTQQQAMSLAFFMMMIFIMMSGLFTPIDSMPGWAKVIAALNPVSYFVDVMRMVVLKGSTFHDIQRHFAIIGGFALFFNTWAVLNYRKTS